MLIANPDTADVRIKEYIEKIKRSKKFQNWN